MIHSLAVLEIISAKSLLSENVTFVASLSLEDFNIYVALRLSLILSGPSI